jgi:hypothetical protein
MKSRGEYLVEFEAKLLGILKDVYKSVNYNLTLAFVDGFNSLGICN